MKNTIKSIDHPVIAVRDLDASRAVYERLGFTVPPRGSHVEWGTGNLCIMFRDDYLELRGIIDPARFTLDLDKHLERHGEGMMGIAFGTTGADAAFEEMTASGMHPKPVRALSRNFEKPEGWVQPRFRLCFPDAADVEGLMHVVLCEHLTPELLREPAYLSHANGVVGVNGIVGVVGDLDRIEAVQRRLLGEAAVSRRPNGLYITVPSGQSIELLMLGPFIARYGAVWPDAKRASHVLPVLRLRVADIAATKRHFEKEAVPFIDRDGKLLVGPGETCGVLMTFES
jgi:catechol 2,3-dioxygenase-like lactoylglutathione lyase family enzyme